MCLAVPAQVVDTLPGDRARVSLSGVEQDISTMLVPKIEVGDYVIVHAGFALSRLDPQEAEKTLQMIAGVV